MKKIILTISLLAGVGCSTSAPISNQDVVLGVEQSHTLIKAGESVTFTARASGVAGREDHIKWEADGGELSLLNDMERYARVTYDKPGVYTVRTKLYVDDRLVDQQRTTVQVDPLM